MLITIDCAVAFPIANAARAISYPFAKVMSNISCTYNVRKLEKELVAKGFTHAQIREKMNENNSKTLDVEKDSKISKIYCFSM